MGELRGRHPGRLRFEVQGIVDGEPVIVVEHITRIHPVVRARLAVPPDGGAGAHKVIIEGGPASRSTSRPPTKAATAPPAATPPPSGGS
jgi:hypothetical protein